MSDDWSLEGKGISCGDCGKTMIEVTGEKHLYDDRIIETLRQKLIKDMNDITDMGFGDGRKNVLNAINKRFGVKE